MIFKRGQILEAEPLNNLARNIWKRLAQPIGAAVRGLVMSGGGRSDIPDFGVRPAITIGMSTYPLDSARPSSESGSSGSDTTDCLMNYPIKFTDLVEESDESTTVENRDRLYVCQNLYGNWIPPGSNILVFEHRGRFFTDYQGRGESSSA